MRGLSTLEQVKVIFSVTTFEQLMQFSCVSLSVMDLAGMMNFAVISDAFKCLKGIIQPEISPVSNTLD